MHRAIAQVAEAEREKRIRQIKAKPELDATPFLRKAAETICKARPDSKNYAACRTIRKSAPSGTP